MSQQTVTGPIALVKVNGTTIGKIRDIRATETIARAEVRGLGNLQAQETPVLSHSGTFSVDSFLVDLRSSGIKKLLNRDVVSPEQFINTLLLGSEKGVDIYIYKKVADTIDDTTGLVTGVSEKAIAILYRCFLDSMNFNISEGQVSTYSQTGRFLDPITFIGV
jgi:hypothetical protein